MDHIGSLLFVLGILLIALTIKDILPKHSVVSPFLPVDTPQSAGAPSPATLISAWTPAAYNISELSSQQTRKETIRTILPSWYQLDSTGNVIALYPLANERTREATSSPRIYIVPSISDGNDATRVKLFLSSEKMADQPWRAL